jgi:type I restriction-modification system DNA methylase subunit
MSKFRFTQVSFASEVKKWIDDIIKSLSLKFDGADIEIVDPSRKRADVILWEKRLAKPALLIEIWDARTPPWEDALDSALSKAWKNNIPYFAVWNLTHFYCWATFEKGDAIDKLWWPHEGVSEVVSDAITYDDAILKYSESIKKYLEIFLREFEQVYHGVKARPPLGIDERFIYRLRGTIHALSIPIFEHIKRMATEDVEFRKALGKFFREQGWSFKGVDEDFEKVSRQYVYLLVNKILFYNVLRSKYGNILPKIVIPETGLTGRELKDRLDSYFKKAYEVTGNFETILLTDFLDSITPPDEVVGLLKDFIHRVGEYDFSKINYEILGNIFQRLIPENERHKLGQYYTRSDVVDLIVGFCVRNADDKVLDGACGAGTFLVRSYVRKKLLNPKKTHRDLLEDLYGVDIARFPAHLSMINLASRDLSEIENYPNIIQRDFFDILPENEYFSTELRIETLSRKRKTIKIPKEFDAVVMNPPYTRQEEMEDILEKEKEKVYKTCIRDWKAMSQYPKDKKPKLSKRSSIYVYFFIHGGYFLKEGGRLGLITSNSWLDVDYGGDLQRFFLENFKIKAVIESKVERWFEDADINTAITILERCSNPEERDRNVVRFVQLKKPLKELIPPVEDEEERWAYVERLIQLIESKDGYYEDEKIRVFTKIQKELWDEGYDEEEEEYVDSKWGKYIRAPDIFFKILEKGKGILVPLKEVAEVRRGFTTGANEFFYLTEEEIREWGIEREFWMHPLRKDEDIPVLEHVWKDKNGEYFKVSQYAKEMQLGDVLRDDGYVYWVPNYVIKSPRECKSILVDPKNLKYRAILIHKDKSELKGTNVLKYIRWGESQGFHLRPTCRSRQRWYELDRLPTNILYLRATEDRPVTYLSETALINDQTFYSIYPRKNISWKILGAVMNSTLFNMLIREVFSGAGIALGMGALWSAVYEVENMLVVSPIVIKEDQITKINTILNDFLKREIGSVFEEIGASSPEEVSLDKVKPDRRELDKIIMGEILGLTEQEQLEVYRAVIDLVKSRIEKAESVQKRKKVGELDVDELVNSVLKDVERLYGIQPRRFPEDYIGGCPCRVVEVPRGSKVEAGFDLEGPYVRIDDVEIRCKSIHEAKYIKYAVLAGKTRIPIPLDEDVLKKAVEERGKLIRDAKAKIEEFLNETIVDRKLKEKVRIEVFKRLGI